MKRQVGLVELGPGTVGLGQSGFGLVFVGLEDPTKSWVKESWPQTYTMQRNCEASLKCLQNKGYPYTLQLQCKGNPIEGCPELKDEIYANPGRNIVEPDRSLSIEPTESSNKFRENHTYQHDFGSWSNFYADSNAVQQSQLNAFDGQFYPFLVDNQFQHAPFNMFPQSYPYEYQFQDFQYFVVIDFEATCDKEKNPHPQEIIEFPSVIVSSMTGQLEACFQTYVRPTCNQLLTDFCKDLTGIQQIQDLVLSNNDLEHKSLVDRHSLHEGGALKLIAWTTVGEDRRKIVSSKMIENCKKPEPPIRKKLNLAWVLLGIQESSQNGTINTHICVLFGENKVLAASVHPALIFEDLYENISLAIFLVV
ncbi:unnamed protein product [Ilex paraguariensis]|uniref:Exonuclease domain-containing protein n=1 Tax=Ilex paraguariensis TaxID=185542 RepID=A0ABC8QMS0_9AQUA